MKNPAARRGFHDFINCALAAVLTLLVLLTALAGTTRLLLLLLAGLLLSAALLSALLLTTLLLLAGLLVWILIHRSFLSNIGLKFSIARAPSRMTMRGPLHSFLFTGPLNFEENVFGTCCRCSEFPSCKEEEPTMGRYLLLWLIGVPIPILALIWIFGGLH